MTRFLVEYKLHEAWETWTVEVPDGTTAEQVLSGEVEADFVELRSSSNDGMTATKVDDVID